MVDYLKESNATHSEPKLNRRLTVVGRSSRVISPGSLSGETLNENDERQIVGSDGRSTPTKDEMTQSKNRIQRQKAKNRKSFRVLKNHQRSNERTLTKSDTIDHDEELKSTTTGGIMKRDTDSIAPSISYLSGSQNIISPQECDNGDSNGNKLSYENCSKETGLILTPNSIGNKSKISNSNNNNNNNNNDNSEFPLQVLSNLNLVLNRRGNGNDNVTTNTSTSSTILSPFESTLKTLPFADEDV